MSNTSLPTYEISLNGKPISAEMEIHMLQVSHHLTEESLASIQVLIPHGPEIQLSAEAKHFIPGAKVTISLGYENKNTAVFAGEVVAQHLEMDAESGTVLDIDCRSGADEDATSSYDPPAVLTLTYGENVFAFQRSWFDEDDALLEPGNATIQGSALAEPGKAVQLNGFGENFSGKALISEVLHNMENGNWITEVQLGEPDEENDFED